MSLVETICWLAGTPDYLDDVQEAIAARDIFGARQRRTSARLFEWLVECMSFQGISDEVARTYMDNHGRPSWRQIDRSLAVSPKCHLLESYWDFHGCKFRKTAWTCANLPLLDRCPLPDFELRNGNLNQMAYSLFLFIRDVAGGDLVGWIDTRLEAAVNGPSESDPSNHLRHAVLDPLKAIHGVSDKVLNMVLSDFLVAGSTRNTLWGKAGGGMIAVDSLIHKFLRRSGILERADASHLYGSRCHQSAGCAGLIEQISAQIDARQFNASFPVNFPRYVQKAIWRYCALEGLSICNGRSIDDSERCQNISCRLFQRCDRVSLAH